MNLHNEIMNIQVSESMIEKAIEETMKAGGAYDALALVYRQGHHDARHAAAELASQNKGG